MRYSHVIFFRTNYINLRVKSLIPRSFIYSIIHNIGNTSYVFTHKRNDTIFSYFMSFLYVHLSIYKVKYSIRIPNFHGPFDQYYLF